MPKVILTEAQAKELQDIFLQYPYCEGIPSKYAWAGQLAYYDAKEGDEVELPEGEPFPSIVEIDAEFERIRDYNRMMEREYGGDDPKYDMGYWRTGVRVSHF